MRERFFVGDLNFMPEIRAVEKKISKKLILQDVTLREPEEGPGIVLSLKDKIAIARKLDEIGIHQIQAGWAVKDREVTEALKREGLNAKISVLAGVPGPAGLKNAIDAAVDSGADVAIVFHRSSDSCLKDAGITREEMLRRCIEAVEYGKERGAKMEFDATDTTRSDINFLKQVYKTTVEAGAQIVGVPDTLGVAKPAVIRFLIEEIKRTVDVPVGVHCHDDFGMGVACTLAGIEGGADFADVSVNGLGPRCGNAPLAPVVMALKGLYGIDLGIKTEMLSELSELVERLTNAKISATAPIVGRNMFAKMFDSQVLSMKKGSHFVTEPFDPEVAGNKRWIEIGMNIGPVGIRAKSEELGIHVTEEKIPQIAKLIKEEVMKKRTSLTDEEFKSVVRRVIG